LFSVTQFILIDLKGFRWKPICGDRVENSDSLNRSPCCARAASGKPTAVPPSNVMNSRRLTARCLPWFPRKDSTPRHGRLLHPSSWAERDDRDHAAKNFFQGGSPKNRPPHFPARTSSPPEIVSDQISGDSAWMNFCFARPPPGGPPLTPPRREAFDPVNAARPTRPVNLP